MNTHSNSDHSFTTVCLAKCQKIVARIQQARAAALTQFRFLIAEHEQALRLALNEAEALAWQTPYPHLVFPDLAEEKARAVAVWSERQHSIRAGGAPAPRRLRRRPFRHLQENREFTSHKRTHFRISPI